MKTIYLAHKYEQAPIGLQIQNRLETAGIRVLNPFQREEQKEFDRIITEKAGQFDDAVSARIVYGDLVKVDAADGVVALLFPNAIGTVMEIFYAGHVRRIPVFTWIAYAMPYRHPWVAHYSHVSDTDLEKVLHSVGVWSQT